jgi:hypothetical protein
VPCYSEARFWGKVPKMWLARLDTVTQGPAPYLELQREALGQEGQRRRLL